MKSAKTADWIWSTRSGFHPKMKMTACHDSTFSEFAGFAHIKSAKSADCIWGTRVFSSSRIRYEIAYVGHPPGNLVYDPQSSITYTYDDENRVTTATRSGSTLGQYTYDAYGRRVRKVSATGTDEFVWDASGNQIGDMQPNGTFNRIELYAAGLHIGTYDNVPGQTVFSHADWLGTERVRSLYSGSSYEACTNNPFGDSQICTGSDPSPIHFTGQVTDVESNLDYFKARSYTSNSGRFMTPDKMGDQHKEDPQSMNLYVYVRNNPTGSTDPSGRYDCVGGNSFCFNQDMANFSLRKSANDAFDPHHLALSNVANTLGTPGDHNGVFITEANLGVKSNDPDAITVDTTITFNSSRSFTKDEIETDQIHEGTHVAQNELADGMQYTDLLGWLGSFVTASRPSWSGLLREERQAYTNQGYMEQALHIKGDIYDPTDVGPGSESRREGRIDQGARRSANSDCGGGSVGEGGSVCSE